MTFSYIIIMYVIMLTLFNSSSHSPDPLPHQCKGEHRMKSIAAPTAHPFLWTEPSSDLPGVRTDSWKYPLKGLRRYILVLITHWTPPPCPPRNLCGYSVKVKLLQRLAKDPSLAVSLGKTPPLVPSQSHIELFVHTGTTEKRRCQDPTRGTRLPGSQPQLPICSVGSPPVSP